MEIKDINAVRYYFEHQLLPELFFSNLNKLVAEFNKNNNFFDFIFFKICKDNNIPDRWLNQFSASTYKYKQYDVIEITCPNAIQESQCNKIYLVYNDVNKYFINSELSFLDNLLNISSNKTFVICGYKNTSEHFVYKILDETKPLLEQVSFN